MLTPAYVAGLFDGEGWVRADYLHGQNRKNPRPGYQLAAGIAMTYAPIIKELQKQFGGVCHGDNSFRKINPNNRTIWRWHVASDLAFKFIIFIEGECWVKAEQICLGIKLQEHINKHRNAMRGRHSSLEFRQARYAEREIIADEMRRLKKVNFNREP